MNTWSLKRVIFGGAVNTFKHFTAQLNSYKRLLQNVNFIPDIVYGVKQLFYIRGKQLLNEISGLYNSFCNNLLFIIIKNI